ncbi:hypothetical protein [Streptomyces sp. TR02-1]|uniref:hypothetical protein n=1 Tax=Streptomyces sp. TR02-1 TaxID=3385977 RepID=UPI0039A1D328
MDDSPVVSEPDTTRATGARHRTLLRWRTHGAETAAVALGTAAVGVQAFRLGPWLTDDAGVALAQAGEPAFSDGAVGGTVSGTPVPAASTAWLHLLTVGHELGLDTPGAWYPGAPALLCFAAALLAATRAVRAVHGRSAWPFALGAGAVCASCPPALAWLFSGTGGALSLLAVTAVLLATTEPAPAGRPPSPWTAAAAGTLAGLAGLALPASPAAPVLGAVGPVALLCRAGRRDAREALRSAAAHAAAWAATCGAVWPPAALPAVGLPGEAFPPTHWAAAAAGAVLLGATGAPRFKTPVRLAAAAAGTGLLLPGIALLPRVALLAAGVLLVLLVLLAPTTLRVPAGHGTVRRLPRGVVVASLALGACLTEAATGSPAHDARTDTLCFTEARYGRMFAAYAGRLGLEHSTVALASSGGTAVFGAQQVLDLHGRSDARVAAARAADDTAALRRYLFVRARPEFVHVDPSEAAATGLTAERLADHGYRPLLRQGPGGDYVHRSAVTVPERLPHLRAWARATAARLSDSPVGSVQGDHRRAGAVEHSIGIRPEERTCTSRTHG